MRIQRNTPQNQYTTKLRSGNDYCFCSYNENKKEDLITLLIERDIIRFTDFLLAAQKRLNSRQVLRKKTQLSKLVDENRDFIY